MIDMPILFLNTKSCTGRQDDFCSLINLQSTFLLTYVASYVIILKNSNNRITYFLSKRLLKKN